MIKKKSIINTLIAIGVAAVLMIPFASCGPRDIGEKAIGGITVEKYEEAYERLPLKLLTMEEMMAKWPPKSGQAGPGPSPEGDVKKVPAIYIKDGKYSKADSKKDVVAAGVIGDTSASGVKIVATGGNIGGVYVTGEGSQYTLSDAEIEISGDGSGLGGMTAGAAVEDHGTLILKNVKITANGASRNTVSCTNNSTLKVYDSTLIGHDAPFDPADRSTSQKVALEINGNSRTTITMGNSYSYFYDSTIIADGWGALSTDAGGDFVYMEANNCKVQTVQSGYAAYADILCHDTFNNCEFDSACMAIIIGGPGDATFNNSKAKCGTYFALIHCVTGSPTEVGTLNVNGGEITCKSPAVIVKSHNVDINFNGVKLVSESGVLVKTIVNIDPNATPTEGKTVYGVHANFKDMDVAGDIIHEDPDRIMQVDLKSTKLSGAIKDAYVTMDAASKWVATADSNVTIVGSVNGTQIDAPEGVTITVIAGETGTYKLASGGTLILKVS